jgi:hypothetical protein
MYWCRNSDDGQEEAVVEAGLHQDSTLGPHLPRCSKPDQEEEQNVQHKANWGKHQTGLPMQRGVKRWHLPKLNLQIA